jgi:hypothetical protein
MTLRCAVFAFSALLLAALGSPAIAGQRCDKGHGGHWRASHNAIYLLENHIAFLEADPEIDDGYKAPVITGDRANILRLRSALPAAGWRWTVPCCYSRRPIYIR